MREAPDGTCRGAGGDTLTTLSVVEKEARVNGGEAASGSGTGVRCSDCGPGTVADIDGSCCELLFVKLLILLMDDGGDRLPS